MLVFEWHLSSAECNLLVVRSSLCVLIRITHSGERVPPTLDCLEEQLNKCLLHVESIGSSPRNGSFGFGETKYLLQGPEMRPSQWRVMPIHAVRA